MINSNQKHIQRLEMQKGPVEMLVIKIIGDRILSLILVTLLWPLVLTEKILTIG